MSGAPRSMKVGTIPSPWRYDIGACSRPGSPISRRSAVSRYAGRPLHATVGPVPAYKHRPPMAGDTPVWRYLTLDAVIATIEARHLRLTRVDRFQDPFEGSVPKKQIEDQIPILIGAASRRAMLNSVAAHYPGMERSRPPDEDPWLRITRLRRARTRSAHASCWSAGDESEAL